MRIFPMDCPRQPLPSSSCPPWRQCYTRLHDIGIQKGNDTLNGNSGDDVLRGGEGKDVRRGDSGQDHLAGGPHVDTCVGSQQRGDNLQQCEK
jgi:hypothetical protein